MVTPYSDVPEHGEVVWINFDPQSGHEQAGHRPAVVLSPRAYNDIVGLAIVCPITNRKKGYPFEVDIPDGSPVTGVILADQVKSLDWRARSATCAGKLPAQTVNETLELLQALLFGGGRP
jgi:mRNA interferase MazF